MTFNKWTNDMIWALICTQIVKFAKLISLHHNDKGAGIDDYSPPDPTRTYFLLPEPDLNYFSKFPSLGFSPASCVPACCFKSCNKNPQILLFFSSRPDTKSSVSKFKCLRYKKWIQGKSGKFDNWFMMHFDLFQSRQSNPRFIHVEAIKSINQDGDKLLSDEAHAL